MSVPDIDNFHLVFPQTSQKTKTSMGSEIIVPCLLSDEICAIAMQIKWFKEIDCVCIYKNRHVIEGRSYKDRASLDTHVLARGDVSLHLNNFSISDVGDYFCQVISGDATKQITIEVRIKPEVQTVCQSPTFQGQSVQLMMFEIDKIWAEEEINKMNTSAVMAEMNVDNEQDPLFKAYIEKCSQQERTEKELRETRMMLDKLLNVGPRAQFLDKGKPNQY